MEEPQTNISKQAKVWGILLIVLIILGTVGFHQYYATQNTYYSWLDCFYLALQLIPMNSGGISSPIPLTLNVARFALPTIAAYAIFSLVWFAFRDKILSIRLRRLRGHVVICGLGHKGNYLARAYQSMNWQVVVIEKNLNNKNLEAYRQEFLHSPVLIADASDKVILQRAGISKAKLLLSTLGQDADNVCVADAAQKALESCRGRLRRETIDCKIAVNDYKIWSLLRETEFERQRDAKIGSEIFRLSYFNQRDSSARFLVNELHRKGYFNPAACGEQKQIGIIGLNNLAELVILHIAREWSQIFRIHDRKIILFVWDKDITRKIETMLNKYPIVKYTCDFSSFYLDPDNPLFKTITTPDCRVDGSVLPMPIYVCAEDQNACVNLSMTAMNAFRERYVDIVALLSKDKGLLFSLNKYRGESGAAELRAVYLLQETCRPDMLDDGTHETLARSIHEVYSLHFAEGGGYQSWENLADDKKEQNRDQARSIGDTLRTIGCGITPWIEYGKDIFRFTESEIEIMAEKEHERWMKMELRQGRTYGEEKSQTTHPCLVSWEELPEDQKQKDRETVCNFPMYLAKAGFQIYRMRTTAPSETFTFINKEGKL